MRGARGLLACGPKRGPRAGTAVLRGAAGASWAERERGACWAEALLLLVSGPSYGPALLGCARAEGERGSRPRALLLLG